jgi:hypothetical protein
MDRFLIAPYDTDSGLQTNMEPWILPEAAFAELLNAYVWRGRVKKRFGSRWLGNTQLETRLRVKIGTVPGGGNFVGLVPITAANIPIATPAIGQMFSIGTQVFTVYQLGVNANMYISGTATLAQFDTTPGVGGGTVTINGVTAGADVYYYPSLPVMGLLTKDRSGINEENCYAFDTRFAYQFTVNGWERLETEVDAGASAWGGSDSQFFWGCNYSGTNSNDLNLFVSNFNENEANFMRWYNIATGWHNFHPAVHSGGTTMVAARLLIPFHGHLLAFNTWEGGQNYRDRMRWSALGNPLTATAFVSDIKGNAYGGGRDAGTNQAILTGAFVKDRLIIYFERSTMEVVYSGDAANPFTWQQLNAELGVESTFSVVSFDQVAMGIGNVGIHACNGFDVDRIDSKIPSTVSSIGNLHEGTARVYGIRDFVNELVYWSIPTSDNTSNEPYPKKVLVYNYKNGTWAENDDSITCFGYQQNIYPDSTTWDSLTVTWDSDETWGSGVYQGQHRAIIAGNQQGYTFIVDVSEPANAASLQITKITIGANNHITLNIIDHNLDLASYIYINGIIDTINIGTLLNDKIFSIYAVTDKDNVVITLNPTVIIAGVYKGAGTVARVSQISIGTKEFNFYSKQGMDTVINRVDFFVDRTEFGKLEVEYYVSSGLAEMNSDSLANGVALGNNYLETFGYPDYYPWEANSKRIWRAHNLYGEGSTIQLYFSMDDTLMRDNDVRNSAFQLHAMLFYATPSSRLI